MRIRSRRFTTALVAVFAIALAACGAAEVDDADLSAAPAEAPTGDVPEAEEPAPVQEDTEDDHAPEADETIEESDMSTYSIGASSDPIGYWWELEEADEDPFLRLAQVLGTTPALSAGGDVWVWPQVTTGRPEHTTDAAWDELTWLEDPEAVRAAGDGYLDWRVGITPDGQWRFFVVGDGPMHQPTWTWASTDLDLERAPGWPSVRC